MSKSTSRDYKLSKHVFCGASFDAEATPFFWYMLLLLHAPLLKLPPSQNGNCMRPSSLALHACMQSMLANTQTRTCTEYPPPTYTHTHTDRCTCTQAHRTDACTHSQVPAWGCTKLILADYMMSNVIFVIGNREYVIVVLYETLRLHHKYPRAVIQNPSITLS